MKALVNTIAAALSLGLIAAPVAAQTAACDPTANTKGDIAKAQFSLTRAVGQQEKGNPTKDLQDVLKLVDNGTDNPAARNYLRGQAYIIYLMQPNAQAIVPRSTLGYTTNPTATIDVFAAADSAFSVVEKTNPECVGLITQWRQQKPWLNTLNAAINALNAGKLDSAEIYANRSLMLDKHAPYAYSVLGTIAQNRKDLAAANQYWRQALTAAGSDTSYADVRGKTLYEIAMSSTERAERASAAEKRALAREASKAWQEYMPVTNNDIQLANALDNMAQMYMVAGDSATIPTIYAPMLANPARYGEIALVHAGVVATRNGHQADAVKLFEAGLAQNAYSRDALNNLAATYIQTNDYNKAFPVINRLIAIDPSNPDNPLLYAFAYQGLYKGTKDKKLQKIYTDSLVYFNNQSENATVKLSVNEFTRRPNETVLGGNVENRGKTSKSFTVTVEFLDKAGNVISTETTTVGPVAPKATQPFRITTAKGGAFGYRYKPL